MLLNCVVGEDSWESFGLQGDWVFFGSTDAEAETLVLWPPHVKSWLTGKDPDAGRDWGQEEKGMTEDEMAGWHHRLDGQECEWTLGVGDGQGGLACCNSWGCKESDTTEWLNWIDICLGNKPKYLLCLFLSGKAIHVYFLLYIFSNENYLQNCCQKEYPNSNRKLQLSSCHYKMICPFFFFFFSFFHKIQKVKYKFTQLEQIWTNPE